MLDPELKARLEQRLTSRRKQLEADVRDKLAAAGLQMAPQFGEDFERACVNEFRQWEALVKAEGLVVQD